MKRKKQRKKIEIKKIHIVSDTSGLNLIYEFSSEYEFDGVGYRVLVVAECFEKRGGEISASYDVLAHSAFNENVFNTNLDATYVVHLGISS